MLLQETEERVMEKVVYGECRRNYAAQLGSHSTDGCGEFCPNSLLSETLAFCTACGCHRNFHRRLTTVLLDEEREKGNPAGNGGCGARTSGVQGHGKQIVELIDLEENRVAVPVRASGSAKKTLAMIAADQPVIVRALEGRKNGAQVKPCGRVKKARTVFTPEQKDMMKAFSDSLGWTVAKKDSREKVKKFCEEVGVSGYVFRTWLNNNKKILGAESSASRL